MKKSMFKNFFEMKFHFYILIIGLLSILSGGSSSASDILFAPSIHYSVSKTEVGAAESSTTNMFVDVRLGAVLGTGAFLGALYGMDDRTTTSGGSSGTTKRVSYGPSIGYVGKSFLTTITYHLSSEWDLGTNVYKGTGLQGDLGYLFELGKSVMLGPVISYRMFTYTEDNNGEFAVDQKYTYIDPYIMFGYMF